MMSVEKRGVPLLYSSRRSLPSLSVACLVRPDHCNIANQESVEGRRRNAPRRIEPTSARRRGGDNG